MLLEAKHITKGFNGYKVINDLSIALQPGMVYALVGANGSGKTTLINLLDGQLLPTYGKILFRNNSILKKKVWDRANGGILRTWQHGREFKNLSVLDNVLVAADTHYLKDIYTILRNIRHSINSLSETFGQIKELTGTRKKHIEKALALLQRYGLEEKQNKSASALSLGQKRLLDFARLQMNDKIQEGNNLILLDEPFSGIDSNNIELIKQTITEFAQYGNAVLMVEHNTELAFEICNRVLLINNGCIEVDLTPEEIVKNKYAREIYFGLN